MDAYRPTIGVTMGDPCGIGAELVVKTLTHREVSDRAKFVVFGFSEQLAYTADMLEVELPFHRDHHEDIRKYGHDLVVLDYDEITMPARMPRGPSLVGGKASMAFCLGAIDAARAGLVDALVTAPICKASWHQAGHKRYPGHTELLAHKCHVRHVVMMFVAPQLKVALATTHLSIAAIRDTLTIGCVFNPIDLADQVLREWFGLESPRIFVAGLNPHAGEDGQFGDEEYRIIAPAILMAKEAGIHVEGPFPGDTIFLKALDGRCDCVVAMYHDQGLIPVKLLGWKEAVNVTLGLPILRTSPDHGTAFDIAGKGKADPTSMIAATNLAIDLAIRKRATEAEKKP